MADLTFSPMNTMGLPTKFDPENRKSNVNDQSILQIVSKERIKQILKKIDPEQRLDADVEDILLDLTGEFIKNVTDSACMLSRHRQSDTVEASDAQILVEKNYNIRIPGFGVELSMDTMKKRKPKNEDHVANVALVREATRKAGVVKRSARIRAKQAK